jgi:hypothetical protein
MPIRVLESRPSRRVSVDELPSLAGTHGNIPLGGIC